MTKLQSVAPENIHTPPNRRDWKFLDGGGGGGGGGKGRLCAQDHGDAVQS